MTSSNDGPRRSQGTRLRGGALAFAIATCVAWASAGPLPLLLAKRGALNPNDFTRDFVGAKVVLRGELISKLDPVTGNAEAVAAGAGGVMTLGSAFHMHPPPAALPILVLVPFGYRWASTLWQAVSLLLLGRLAWLLGRLRPARSPSPVLWYLLLLGWAPVLTNVELGQWSILLATLVAEAHRCHESGRPGRAGAWLGAAVATKLTPIIFVVFFAPRSRRALLAMGGAFLVVCLVAFPFGGLDPWYAFVRDVDKTTTTWQTFWHNTLSLNGLVARALVGGRFATPFVTVPGLARALLLAASGVLVAVAFVLGRPARGQVESAHRAYEGCRFAMWAVLAVVLNPIAWAHYGILLLLPAVLVLRATDDHDLAPRARGRVRALVAVALVALTVPKETLFLLVEPFPAPPWRSLLVSVHLCGALALFGAAALAIRRAPSK